MRAATDRHTAFFKIPIAAAVFLVLLPTGRAHAAPVPAGIFVSGMVLQCEHPTPVWGTARPFERVTVSFAGQSPTTTADGEGRWMIRLPPLASSAEPRDLTIHGAEGSPPVVVRDVVVGEVWFCAGQSNMELSLHEAGHAAEEQARPANPLLRVFSHRKHHAENPASGIHSGRWSGVGPKNVAGVYATAYYFGAILQEELDVPVGLIQSAWGGTPIQAWMSREMLASDPETAGLMEKGLQEQTQGEAQNARHAEDDGDPRKMPWPDWRSAQTPTRLFNGMVHPFIPFAIRGVIWYQGEHNASDPLRYAKLFPAMIGGWRASWGEGDFPFLFCQLPGLKAGGAVKDGNISRMRLIQSQALRLPNTGMAVIYDTAEELDNHPKNKRPAGERLARIALATIHGRPFECFGPTFAGMKPEGNKLRVSFDHVGGGLVARDVPATYRPISSKPETHPVIRRSPGSQLEGFEVQDAGGRWHWAKAAIDGEAVTVEAEDVPRPVEVRYGCADFGFFNLFNAAGLPAAPFDSTFSSGSLP